MCAKFLKIGKYLKYISKCPSKIQPLDVCINKPFKSILRECCENHAVIVVKDAGHEANNNSIFKLSSPTRQDIVNWVHRGYVFLQDSKAMIQCSFEVCGKVTANPELVCNDDFLTRIMANTEVDSDRTDDDDDDDDDMFKNYLKTKTKHFLFNFCIQYLLAFVVFY